MDFTAFQAAHVVPCATVIAPVVGEWVGIPRDTASKKLVWNQAGGGRQQMYEGWQRRGSVRPRIFNVYKVAG